MSLPVIDNEYYFRILQQDAGFMPEFDLNHNKTALFAIYTQFTLNRAFS